ncbi:hypothetical protein ThrDRAFT_01246 [Frankia casuarinae]|uniref:hypothetical protein n=1 Tax=Frankia TaxID=1854 RepID=UPI0002FF351E|nr:MULTISPECIES: hypothetical protein [Frankia]KEZ37870.1 hypothetical protein CEDDRAFT_00714 [Frankia sp. CeD]ETA02674.1 hypothetical protein CcI6DRAFT_01851 [Frankia sp. CcI6]EYT93060.1 hypothetical protein ThrDRAFT_01246 [Frankia casuarinae]KDA44116.1 hypothetical protein BMG523Draft_00913 [Frankia sp. BMG5.23]KFB07016.1 hypothetical protein ALLO2DRAFT_00306 [Frankia sp. Allo2]
MALTNTHRRVVGIEMLVGPNRPYGGGAEPTLTAWIRLREDDHPPDTNRLMRVG